jgi:cation:H+ antiporter
MPIAQLGLLVIGLGLLFVGAELLVRGASRLAAIAGISPLVIGLTVVAYGTSSPEMVVSVASAYSGQADIALGNLVGSNIFNVLFILGICAVILPLRVAQQLVWLDVPLMIGATLLLLLLGLDGTLSRLDGIFLFSGSVLYTVFAMRQGLKESAEVRQEYAGEYGEKQQRRAQSWPRQLIYIALGLGMLIFGARWLVDGAVAIAKLFSISDFVVGLTIVAAGTSLPEVATSVVASFRGERDIAVGNVVGSNIFNILAVLGLSSIVSPNGMAVPPAALSFDIPVMIAVALACAPIFFTGHLIARWEGMLFLLYYGAYTGYLALDSKGHDSLPFFNAVMLEFALPLTLVTVVIAYLRYAAKASPLAGDRNRVDR